jgi:hypothetical protein
VHLRAAPDGRGGEDGGGLSRSVADGLVRRERLLLHSVGGRFQRPSSVDEQGRRVASLSRARPVLPEGVQRSGARRGCRRTRATGSASSVASSSRSASPPHHSHCWVRQRHPRQSASNSEACGAGSTLRCSSRSGHGKRLVLPMPPCDPSVDLSSLVLPAIACPSHAEGRSRRGRLRGERRSTTRFRARSATNDPLIDLRNWRNSD